MKGLAVTLISIAALAGALFAFQKNERIGEAGQFDSYMLSMSWSPAYCADRRTADPQCEPGRAFAFVLHGLWPQYENGRWPQFCSDEPGLPNPDSMLDIMPSPRLVSHEWAKHGTCSGLGAAGYFKLARRAFESVKVPRRFQAPKEYVTIAPAELKREFLEVNPAIKPEGIGVYCSSGYLSEVRVCLDKSLKPVSCSSQRECRASEVRMPPIR